MRMMVTGLAGWMKMSGSRSEAERLIDGSITVIATLLFVLTLSMLH